MFFAILTMDRDIPVFTIEWLDERGLPFCGSPRKSSVSHLWIEPGRRLAVVEDVGDGDFRDRIDRRFPRTWELDVNYAGPSSLGR